MDKYTKQVIERYSNLIEINDWETFYIKLKGVYNNSNIGQITEILLEAGIDPLKDLDYIPENYLAGSDIDSFTVPEHIKIIEEGAFDECQKLGILYFPNSLEIVKFRAFRNCHSLEDIYFNGTHKQFSDIVFEKGWSALIYHPIQIHCTDDSFRILEI